MEGRLSKRVKELFKTNPEMIPILVEYLLTKKEDREKRFKMTLTDDSISIVRKIETGPSEA